MLFVICFTCILKPNILLLMIKKKQVYLVGDIMLIKIDYGWFNRNLLVSICVFPDHLFPSQSIFCSYFFVFMLFYTLCDQTM